MKSLSEFILLNEIIAKPYSPTLFHFTTLGKGKSVLQHRKFKLSTDLGTNSEKDSRAGNRQYYISTARSPHNDYSQSGAYRNGVQFELNRDHLASRHKIVPKDYWERMGNRHRETEDRVYHHKSAIDFPKESSHLVKAVHVFHDFEKEDSNKNYQAHDHQALRHIFLHAKKQNIPVHFYDNQNDFLTGNTKNAKPIHSIIPKLKGTPETYPQRSSTDWTKPYRELALRKPEQKSKLSSDASRKLYSIKYRNYNKDVEHGLDSEIHNLSHSSDRERDFRQLEKLTGSMKKLKSKNTTDFISKIRDRWKTDD